jgi:hypothetical protein
MKRRRCIGNGNKRSHRVLGEPMALASGVALPVVTGCPDDTSIERTDLPDLPEVHRGPVVRVLVEPTNYPVIRQCIDTEISLVVIVLLREVL